MASINRTPGEPGGGTSGGQPGAPGAGSGGTGPGTGTPPAQDPNPGGTGTPAPVPSIPLDALPEELRGKPVEQIKGTLGMMVQSLKAQNARQKQLEDKIKELERKPAEPVAPPKPKDDRKLADRLLDEPEAALDEYFQGRAAPVLGEIKELRSRLAQTEFESARREIDDFAEYEDEISEMLQQTGAEPTRENVRGAYTMAVGMRTLESRERARREGTTSLPAAPAGSEESTMKKYNKTPLSEEIRLGLRMSEEEYYEKYASPDSFKVKVPT
jgi:hypothetical protein